MSDRLDTLFVLLFSTVALLLSGPAALAACNDADADNCFIVRSSAADLAAASVAHGLSLHKTIGPPGSQLALVTGPGWQSPAETLAALRADSKIRGAERVLPIRLDEISSNSLIDEIDPDPGTLQADGVYSGAEAAYFTADLWQGFMNQPAAQIIRLPEVRATGKREAFGIGVVAILDTGVDADHPVLEGALVSGHDFILGEDSSSDEWSALAPTAQVPTQENLQGSADQSFASILEGGGTTAVMSSSSQAIVDQSFASILESEPLPTAFGHGTMVAGLVRMVAPGVKIMPLRVFDGDGHANSWDVIQAIYYATDHGATVINMSFSIDDYSVELARAVNYAESHGVVCVSSAGNSGRTAQSWPAAFGNVLGVASTDIEDNLSAFSNFGPHVVSLAAPGEGLVTTYPGGHYALVWGTSFSAALISGAVTLLNDEQADGSLLYIDAEAADEIFAASSVEILINQHAGHGRMDVFAALGYGLEGY